MADTNATGATSTAYKPKGKQWESDRDLTLDAWVPSVWPEVVGDGGNGAVKVLGRLGENDVDLPNGGVPA